MENQPMIKPVIIKSDLGSGSVLAPSSNSDWLTDCRDLIGWPIKIADQSASFCQPFLVIEIEPYLDEKKIKKIKMIKIMSSSILMVLITIAVTFLVINLQSDDSKRLQNGSEKWNENDYEIEEDFEVLAEQELYIDIVATLEPALESEFIEPAVKMTESTEDFDINLYIKGKFNFHHQWC